jgi:hypothetical protein
MGHGAGPGEGLFKALNDAAADVLTAVKHSENGAV